VTRYVIARDEREAEHGGVPFKSAIEAVEHLKLAKVRAPETWGNDSVWIVTTTAMKVEY